MKIHTWIIYGCNFKSFRNDLLLLMYRPTNVLSELYHQIISVPFLRPRKPAGVPLILRPPPLAQHERCLIMRLSFLFGPRSMQSTSFPRHDGCFQVSSYITSLLTEEGCLALSLPGLQVPLFHQLELLLEREAGSFRSERDGDAID